MVTYNFAIVIHSLSPLIISSIDTFIDVKTLNGTYIAAGLLATNLLAHPISSLAETKKFPDVSDSAWSKDAIYYLVERNVINGMPDGNFMPYGNLTRAQAKKDYRNSNWC